VSEQGKDLRYQLVGWLLFVLCAALFIASSWRNGDTLALIGSFVFLLACVAFLVPLLGAALGARLRAGGPSRSTADQAAEAERERDQ